MIADPIFAVNSTITDIDPTLVVPCEPSIHRISTSTLSSTSPLPTPPHEHHITKPKAVSINHMRNRGIPQVRDKKYEYTLKNSKSCHLEVYSSSYIAQISVSYLS
jgi:hypothetical protein